MPDRLFIINNKLFAKSPCQLWEYPLLVYCHKCGEVWARLPVEESTKPWGAVMGVCESCRDDFMIPRMLPGSLLLNTHLEVVDNMPVEVWKRELELELKLWGLDK